MYPAATIVGKSNGITSYYSTLPAAWELLGENAFKLTDTYKKGEKISGLTPMQRYFLGYTLGWMYQIRPEQLASQVITDVHAPAKFRVNGPFPNVPAFYEAFAVKPGDKMYLPDSARVKLW